MRNKKTEENFEFTGNVEEDLLPFEPPAVPCRASIFPHVFHVDLSDMQRPVWEDL